MENPMAGATTQYKGMNTMAKMNEPGIAATEDVNSYIKHVGNDLTCNGILRPEAIRSLPVSNVHQNGRSRRTLI